MKNGVGPRNLGVSKQTNRADVKSMALQSEGDKKRGYPSEWDKRGPQVDDTPEGRGEATRTIDKVKSAIQAPFSDKTYGDFKKGYRAEQKVEHKKQKDKRADYWNYWIERM